MNTNPFRLTLLGVALGILIALFIAPQTRWLVRAQLSPALILPGHTDRQRRLFVQQHPHDLPIQLAGQTDDAGTTPLMYDRSLVSKFPDCASLRAKILREATTREVRLHRDEDNLLAGKPPTPFQPGPNDPASSAAQLAAFDADAAAGERLDPDNAYFPFMRAVGLFAARRDAEGLAAIQRASAKPVWQEYYQDEVEGRWRINDALYGGREALSAGAVSAAVLFPHYSELRQTARIVEYKAILDEQAGHLDAGLAKREALARLGELMGVQSTAIIGNLVGVAINMISRSRPGGGPPVKFASQTPGDVRVKQNVNTYCGYVVRIGRPEAVAQAQADYQTWQQIHRITSQDLIEHIFGVGLAAFVRLGIALAAGWAVLPNALSVFVLGLFAAGLSRLPHLVRREPLPAGAASGFWAVLLTGLAVAAVFVDAVPEDFALSAALVVAMPLVFAGLLAALVPRLRRPVVSALLSAGITAGVFGLYAAVMLWQGQSGASIAQALREALSLSGSASDTGQSDSQKALLLTLLWMAFTLAVPLLTAIVLSVRSRIKRVPVSVGLVLGFRSVMPLLIFGLMLVYGGLTLWTVQQEARANYGLERSLHGEGQYLAQLTGLAWPQR